MPPRNEASSLRSLGVAAARALMGDAVRAMCRRLHSRGIQVKPRIVSKTQILLDHL